MIILKIHFSVANTKQPDVVQTIQTIIEPTLAISACKSCGLYTDVMDDETLFFFEAWESRQAFEEHVTSTEFKKVLICLDLAISTPEIFICDVFKVGGIEAIEKIFDTTTPLI